MNHRPVAVAVAALLSAATAGLILLPVAAGAGGDWYPTTTVQPTTTTTVQPTTTVVVTTPQTVATTTTSVPASTTTTSTTTIPATTTTVVSSTSAPTSSSVEMTTTTSLPPSSTTTSTAIPTTTSSTLPASSSTSTTTTLPDTFDFGAALTVCVREVPTIRITFQNLFPTLAGLTGTLTMTDVNGNPVSSQPLVYNPGQTVDILYPGTAVNPDGTVADVPGWTLNADGFWVRDPSDAFLRDGINLTYQVNPTATAFVTYPPESSACANPPGPFPPTTTTTVVLPVTR